MNTVANLANEIRQLVKANNHGDAYEFAARALGSETLAKRFADINRRHREAGHLTFEMHGERHGAYELLMQLARRRLGPDFEAFYAAF